MTAEQINELSVGIPAMDSQHRELLRLVEQLESALHEGLQQQAVCGLFEQLLRSTRVHFRDEEGLMRAAGFYGLKVHCQAHQDLLARAQILKDQFDAGDSMLTPSVISFLKRWLVEHMQGADREYARVLRAASKNSAAPA